MSMANSISSLTKEELDHFIDGLEKVPGIDPKAIWYFRTGLIIRQQLAAAGEDEASARWVFNNWLYAVRMTFPVNAVENYDTRMPSPHLSFKTARSRIFMRQASHFLTRKMKELNIHRSRALTGVLVLRDLRMKIEAEGEGFWKILVTAYNSIYFSHWEHTHQPLKG